jgi:hypothetical protein
LTDDNAILTADDDGDGSGTIESRVSFIQQFALLSDPMSSSGVLCLLCQLDPTAKTPEMPAKTYARFKLEKHLAGNFHDRHDQVAQANREAVVDNRVSCRLCGKSFCHDSIFKHWKEVYSEFRSE